MPDTAAGEKTNWKKTSGRRGPGTGKHRLAFSFVSLFLKLGWLVNLKMLMPVILFRVFQKSTQVYSLEKPVFMRICTSIVLPVQEDFFSP